MSWVTLREFKNIKKQLRVHRGDIETVAFFVSRSNITVKRVQQSRTYNEYKIISYINHRKTMKSPVKISWSKRLFHS